MESGQIFIGARIMKVLTVYFDKSGKRYERLLNVFRNSAIKNIKKAELQILCVSPPDKKQKHSYDCAYAFITAAEFVLEAKEDMMVSDCDMMIMGDMSEAWKHDFDIAVTTRQTIPFNTGIWFVRWNNLSEDFIIKWIDNTKKIIDNYDQYVDYVHGHGGFDQASLALTIDENPDIKVVELPCQEWNACQHEWEHVTEKTKAVHIKSKLRKACLGEIPIPFEYMNKLVQEWKSYE
jgi:hypothetical protein